MLMPAPSVVKPWSVARPTTVLPTPMIDFTSARQDVKVNNDPDIKADDSPFIEQPLWEPPTYDPPPVEQQDILYDFY